jgi:T5SS/PEP-CTERM-associated repeat protein
MENADFNQSGGVASIRTELHVADVAGVVGNLNITGGQFFATNDLIAIGREGIGNMVISNATAVFTNTSVGRHLGSSGTLTLQNSSSLSLIGDLSIGRLAGASGSVQIDGGILSVTNDDLWIGRAGAGDLTVAGGTLRARRVHVGESEDGIVAPTGNFSISAGNVSASSNLVVGTPLISSGQLTLTGGAITVTNVTGSAFVQVSSGSVTMSGGTLTTDKLLINDASATFTFNDGIIRAKAMTVSNGQAFTVGDGVNPATLELQGGTYTFANGLVISPNATVTGCGTVIGTIVNNGTYNNTCGGSSPSPTTISTASKSAGTVTISCASQSGFSYTLEYKTSLTNPTWTPLLPATLGNGGTLNLSDTAATNVSRFYRVKVQ